MGISTHVLDTTMGRPAAGVPVALFAWRAEAWVELGRGKTDADGRMLADDGRVEAGVYRLRFETAGYYAGMGVVGFYPWVEIVFEAKVAGEKFHLPLLLTGNGYTTYRGS